MVMAEKRQRSLGVTIFSVSEIVLGVAAIIAGTVCLSMAIKLYAPASTNVSLGFAIMFTVGSYFLALFLLSGGILMFLLKPAGRIISICLMMLTLPLSIFFLLYLLSKSVREQFKGN